MESLWAPWRMSYIAGPKPPGCIFCGAAAGADDRANLVLAREPALVMLNKFPYANGHLMVAPLRHTADFASLSPDELATLMRVVQTTAERMTAHFRCDGMNIGINLGAAAGAGVRDHMHWHLVPRWVGDHNFMPLLAESRVINEHLEATWEKLVPLFA